MKKRILTLTLLLLTAIFTAEANPVDMNTAREVAVKFVNANAKTPLRSADDIQLVTTYNIDRGDAAFHIFNTPNGFVIVSADDCATPILGYSDEGRFDVDNVPIQLQDYLQGFVEQIQYGIENHLEADEATARQWELVRSIGHIIKQRATIAVAPLLTDTWDQDCYYNAKCPEDPEGPCGHVVTGCSATSFAQIMRYWGYPTNGMGSHTYTPPGYPEQTVNFTATTYDWAHMPNSLSSSSSTTEINAIATLMWHCGVAINMRYGVAGSGAVPDAIPWALRNYFGYSNELSLIYKSNYNDDDWLALMKTCLDVGRPIYYCGWDANYGYGHGFVCDGYDANNLLHFNWGWSGYHNGYYSINAMNPGNNAFTANNMAIINIHPNCPIGTTYQITVSTDPSNSGTISGMGSYNCGEVCTLTATDNSDYSFMYWTEDGEQVSSEAAYSFRVMNDRNLVAHYISEESIVFADANVKSICVSHWDTNGDGELSYAEAASVEYLGDYFQNNTEITSFEELQYFINLTAIDDYAFSGCSGFTGSLTIPNFITTIGDYAFKNCSGFTGNLTIPNSVTWIGNSAFYNCSGFTGNLTIPNSVTRIDNSAFYNCSGFTGNLTISNSVTAIGNSAFCNCSGFTGNLTIPNSVTAIGNSAFCNCSGFTGNLTIPNSVTSISDSAFKNCSGFTGNLIIPNSVTWIGYDAFYNCSGFTGTLTISNSVTAISSGTFYHCSGFTGDLTIPNSVTSIGWSAFNDCSGFTGNLTIPNSVTAIGYSAFYNCSGFTGNLTIPNSVATIGSQAFYNCTGFTGNLTIPNSVTTIDSRAFYNCSGFTGNLTISNSVTTISSRVFYNCTGFTGNLTIPNSVTTIEDYAFYNCSGFTGELTISTGVTAIGMCAFKNCTGFTGVLVIPNAVTTIGDFAFSYCSGFTGSLTIPNSVTAIGSSAFSGCSNFTDALTIPNSVTTIGSYAFNGCNGFTGNLTIGSSVVTIGNYAFGYNRNFTSMKVLPETPPRAGNAFYRGLYGIPVYVPCGSLEAYQEADGWSNFTNYQEDCIQTQTITLSQGWNLISTYLADDPVEMLDMLKASLGENATGIQSEDNMTEFDGAEWFGDLDEIGLENEKGYFIYVNNDCTVELMGTPANVGDYEINIHNGWNIIGFPSAVAIEVNTALANFEAAEGDRIQTDYGMTEYDGEWFGDMEAFEPGFGIMYYSNSTEPKTLVFSTTAGGKSVFLRKRKE